MSYRPPIVGWLSWLFIASGVLGFSVVFVFLLTPEVDSYFSDTPMPLWFINGVTFVSSLAYLISGIALLKRRNWGRHLLLWTLLPMLVVSLLYAFDMAYFLLSLVLLAVMVLPLYRPSVKRYFLHQQTDTDIANLTQKESAHVNAARKVLAIIAFVVSGFFIYLLTVMSFINVYGAYDVLLDASRLWAGGFVLAHGLGLWLYNAPARFLASGIALICGTSFTAFAMWIITSVPLPETLSSFDLQSQFTGFAVGIPFTAAIALIGCLQVAAYFIGRARTE